MRISLNSPVRKTAFLGVSVIFFLSGWALSWQSLLEWYLTRAATLEGFQRAARLQPLNALHRQALGTIYLHLDHRQAATELERAVELNPHSADAWLRLADAYSVLGYSDHQRRAIFAALKAAPRDTSSQWQAATLFLADGDTDTGLKLMREAVSNDTARAPAAMQIGFMISDGNVPKTLLGLPAGSGVRLQFMRWLMERGHATDSDIVWREILNSGEQFKSKDAFFYVNSLLERQEVAMARSAWRELGLRDKELANRSKADELLNNGEFEDSLLNAGFGWRYAPASGVTVTIDTTVFHSGTRALSLQMNSGNLEDSGVFQLVPVEPGSHYSLQAFVRGEEIESANGIRTIVTDAYSKQILFTSDEAIGSFPWRETTGQFTTGSNAKLVRVGIGRSPSDGRIRGRFWIDDVRMEKK
jgi:tetratricopeptide (TPR) repeat protein